jgi:DinB superfamily
MPEDHSDAVALFRRGPELLDAAIAGVSQEESKFVLAPGKWTIRQIVRHLTDTEIVVGMRLRQMIAENRPLMAVFDQDLWADHLHYNNCDVFDSAMKFRILRDDMSNFLAPLPAEEYERIGLHPERGVWTLHKWVNHFGVHTEKHVQQVRGIREAWSRH